MNYAKQRFGQKIFNKMLRNVSNFRNYQGNKNSCYMCKETYQTGQSKDMKTIVVYTYTTS